MREALKNDAVKTLQEIDKASGADEHDVQESLKRLVASGELARSQSGTYYGTSDAIKKANETDQQVQDALKSGAVKTLEDITSACSGKRKIEVEQSLKRLVATRKLAQSGTHYGTSKAIGQFKIDEPVRNALKDGGLMTPKQIADETGKTVDEVEQILARLAANGELGTAGRMYGTTASVSKFNDVTSIVPQTLNPNNPVENGYFGRWVGISDNWALIDGEGSNTIQSVDFSGRTVKSKQAVIECFRRQSDDTWRYVGNLPRQNYWQTSSMSMNDNWAFVGADYNNLVHVYRQSGNGWRHTQTIKPHNPRKRLLGFGHAVSVNEEWLVVGACYEEGSNGTEHAGGAHIYRWKGHQWDHVHAIPAPNPQKQAYFGFAASISGKWAFIAAPEEDYSNDLKSAGRVYVYHLQDDGTWDYAQTFQAPNPQKYALFGRTVSISGKWAFVGAENEDYSSDLENVGRVYVYHLQDDHLQNPRWRHVQTFEVTNPRSGYFLGSYLSISGDRAVVGTGRRVAELYSLKNDKWLYTGELSILNVRFTSTCISGDWATVGAKLENRGTNTCAGRADIYSLKGI